MKFGIIGAMGRMGQSIARLSSESNEWELMAPIENSKHPHLGHDYGELINLRKISVKLTDLEAIKQKKNLEGLIDFSIPSSSIEAIQIAKSIGIPIVIGTTGFTSNQFEIIQKASQVIPILISSNMSLGVNLLFYLTKRCAHLLREYEFDPEIMEMHHRFKKDSPSGTANTLAEIILEQYGWQKEKVTHGRKGFINKKIPPSQLGMHSMRGGDIVGEHTVHFIGEGEKIELLHKATSRDIFAKGALQALSFLKKQTKPYLYDMQDVLGLKNK